MSKRRQISLNLKEKKVEIIFLPQKMKSTTLKPHEGSYGENYEEKLKRILRKIMKRSLKKTIKRTEKKNLVLF